jgi:hypothetical protein
VVIVHGQRWLNTYWSAAAGRTVRARLHWAEWLLLALVVAFLGLTVIRSLQAPGQHPSTVSI